METKMDDHRNRSVVLRALLTKLGQNVVIRTRYTCMRPIIAENSLVCVAPISKPLRRGDILLIDQGYRFVTHRLLKIDKNGVYYTSGDNGLIFDTCDYQNAVLGVITSVKNGDGWYAVNNFKILQCLLAIIGYASVRRSSQRKREIKEKFDLRQAILWKIRTCLTYAARNLYEISANISRK